MLLVTSSSSASRAQRVKLAALVAPLAVLSIVAGCNAPTSSAASVSAPAAPSAQIAPVAGGNGGSPKNAGVRAYAHVDPDQVPMLVATRTSGFTAISRPAGGVYCLVPPSGVSPESSPAIVSLVDGYGSDKSVEWSLSSDVACPAGSYRVSTYGPVGRMSTLSFTILVP